MKRFNNFVQFKQENPYSDKDIEFEMLPSPRAHVGSLESDYDQAKPFKNMRRSQKNFGSASVGGHEGHLVGAESTSSMSG